MFPSGTEALPVPRAHRIMRTTMRAAAYERFGDPEILSRIRQLVVPPVHQLAEGLHEGLVGLDLGLQLRPLRHRLVTDGREGRAQGAQLLVPPRQAARHRPPRVVGLGPGAHLIGT